jgi:peptidoglycan/xylan/chitin deacetylase (PgdA/CDA1 family)
MRGLIVTPQAFARQMGLLKMLGYQGLAMRDLEPYFSGEKQGKVFGITFDDGYQNNLTHALPVLQHYGFSATCYAVSQQIGGTNYWDESKGITIKPLMNRTEWLQWQVGGMEIGSHTRNHVDLRALSPAAAWEEIAHSKTDLEQWCGQEVRHFCYPYGFLTPALRDQVAQSGYTTATTTQRARATVQDDPLCLPRVLVSGSNTLLHLLLKISTSYEDKRKK